MAIPDYASLTAPFRLRALKAVTAALKEITPTNGYIHDMSDFLAADGRTVARVYRGRNVFSAASDPLPMLSVLEDPRQLDPTEPPGWDNGTFSECEWKLAVMGFIGDDMDNPTDPAHFFAADTYKCLMAQKASIGDLLGQGGTGNSVQTIKIGQPVVRPAESGISDTAFFFIPLKLMTVESGDPFA